ncbi:MAG TPA: phosphoenolpyruvate--protein phosphotransferase [Victivallales bacterium]|nr:phosphoenolpyruvate--protein phosphotransferase [Victivallales bacterium]
MNSKILHILKEITSLFAYSKDNRLILPKIVGILARNLECEVCSIYAYEKEKDRLVLAATHGLNQDIIGKFSLKPSEGITGHAFSENQIINVANSKEDNRFMPAKNSGEEKYKSMLSCPLVVGGRRYGVINLQSSSSTAFDDDIIEIIKSLSVQVANIIESSKIFSSISVSEFEKKSSSAHDLPLNVLKGTPANQGLAVGRIIFLDRTDEILDIPQENHKSESKELLILEHALKRAKAETSEMGERALEMISEADASIFSVHLLFLDDKTLIGNIKKLISEGFTAEYSVKKVCDEYLSKFEKMDSEIFREKAADLKDVMIHLIKEVRKIKGDFSEKRKTPQGEEKYIIAAHELLPSDILRIPISNVSGYISEMGGVTAHFAILARALNIPAMMGVKSFSSLRENEKVILDCYAGNIYLNPDKNTEEKFSEVIRSKSGNEIKRDAEAAMTSDGKHISVMANLSLVSELPLVITSGADGVGLYRTEFIYMIRDYPPSEENQIAIYSKISSECPNGTLTFRILDVGSDKPLPYLNFARENNPSMGYRGIRIIEENEDIFRTQISAILRASKCEKTRILVPMASSLEQIRKVKKILSDTSKSLSSRGIPHAKKIELGIMIEIPSVVYSLDLLIPEIDFASIGSNDMMQFFFATDRTNEKISPLASFHDPSFLKLVKNCGEAFSKSQKKLSICGEIASDRLSIPLLIGAGINELSVISRAVCDTKQMVRAISEKRARALLAKCIKCENASEAKELCAEFVDRL